MGGAPVSAPKGGMDDAFGELFDTNVPAVALNPVMPVLAVTNVENNEDDFGDFGDFTNADPTTANAVEKKEDNDDDFGDFGDVDF